MLAIEVTEHAIKRYGERVRPALGASELEAEVLRVIQGVGVVDWHKPSWAGTRGNEIIGWVRIGDDIAFALQFHRSKRNALVAVTCITRCAFGEERREARNRRARLRRQARAARRRNRYVPRGARVAV